MREPRPAVEQQPEHLRVPILGCHVQLVREDPTDQQFALVSVVMKIMECICKFGGNIYTMDELTICAVFLEHMDMMAAGCIIDQELGPLIDDFGYDITICGMQIMAQVPMATNPTPFAISRLNIGYKQHKAMQQLQRQKDEQDDDANKGSASARQPQDASPMAPSRWSNIEDLPDVLQKIEVPTEMDEELNKLLDRVMFDTKNITQSFISLQI